MVYFDKKKSDRIDNLQKKLYSKSPEFKDELHTHLVGNELNGPKDWNDGDLLENPVIDEKIADTPENKNKSKIFGAILLVATLFFVGSIVYATYIFLGGQSIVSGQDIKMNIVGPISVAGGDKYSVDVLIQNNSPVELQSAQLVIEYPNGTKTSDLRNDLRRARIDLGNIKINSVVKETLDMAFLGENGEIKQIDLKLEYRLSGSSALFDKSRPIEVMISAAPVQIVVDALQKISSGQTIELNVELRSNSTKEIPRLILSANYPFGFIFEKSDVNPSVSNNIWIFENVKPTDIQKIKITGKIQAQDNENRSFRFSAGTPSDNNPQELGVTLTNTRHVVTIERPFLDLQLTINGASESSVVALTDQNINTGISFINNTENIIRDVEVVLNLEGAVLNRRSINVSDGFYSSFDDTIKFNKDTFKDLAEVAPRRQVNMLSIIRALDLTYNNRGILNPEIKISATVSGRRISESGADEQIQVKDFATIKLLSDIAFGTFTGYNVTPSAIGGFVDSGPIPPRANQETIYTITWVLNNSSNDLTNARIVANLPPYVSWKNASAPQTEEVIYDANNRNVIWNLKNVTANTGHTLPSRRISFQIALLPSLSQSQQTPAILRNIKLFADDAFADAKIERDLGEGTIKIEGRDTADLHHYVSQ